MTARLSGALRSHADRYRTEAALDFTLLDALVKMDELEAAADTLQAHRESLQALARDLQDVVADAAEERDHGPVAALHPEGPLGIRRRLVALTSAAAVLLTLVLPAGRALPRTILAAVEGRFEAEPEPAEHILSVPARPQRARVLAPASTDERPGPGNNVARKTVRAISAADAAGGSAAADQPESAPVISMEAARAARRQARQDARPPKVARDELPPVPSRPAEEQQSDPDLAKLDIELDEPKRP